VRLLYAVYYGLDRGAELVTSASVGASLKAVEREVAPAKKIAKINKFSNHLPPALGHLWGDFNTNRLRRRQLSWRRTLRDAGVYEIYVEAPGSKCGTYISEQSNPVNSA